MSNGHIDGYYRLARESDKTRLRHALRAAGPGEVRFRFDFAGTNIATHS